MVARNDNCGVFIKWLRFNLIDDCGALVKEYAPSLEGKGGGGKNFARAVFPSSDRALSFVEIINK